MRSRGFVAISLFATLALGGILLGDGIAKPQRDYTLVFGEFAFDPLRSMPEIKSGWDRSKSAGKDLHLVQLHGPTKNRTMTDLKAAGLEVVQYVHPYTYIVWGSPSQRNDIEKAADVRWTGDFAPAFRVQPKWRNLKSDVENTRVLIYRGAGSKAVHAAIRKHGGTMTGRRVLDKRFEIATFELPGDRVQAVANVAGVYSISLEPTDGGLRSELSNQVNVNNVDASNLAFPGYMAWLTGVGVNGSGVIMANVDGGIDDTHPDLVNRMLPCVGSTCGGGASDSHGTHTAGIMAADGTSGVLNASGFLRGLGVAPGANLVEQLYNPTFLQAGGMLTLIRQSRDNNAVLSGNSWGPAGTPRGYDDDTMQVDIGVRDSDPNTPGNQQFSYILSFMNGGGFTQTQGTPDEAKNLFTIGSTKMRFSTGGQDTEIDDLSSNTAHGPALDARTIPHMVAPGCYVDSTDTIGGGYGFKCGTSMASPHVSGAVGLFFAYYRGLPDYVADPSPALVKAAFLAVARNLAGNQDANGGLLGNAFDSKQGWGRMDLEAVLDPPPDSVRYVDEPVIFDNTGEEWIDSFSALDPGQPVRIMLVWTDAPGHGLGGSTPAWNNDLDLVVESGGNTYLGNNFGLDGRSTTGGTADFRNNTEGVFLPAGTTDVTIRVVASNINSDGVPGVGDLTDQDFAVACYNCAAEPGFRLVVPVNAAEICAPATASFSIDVTETLGFSNPVTLTATGVPAGATSSFSVNPVTPPGNTNLQIDDTVSAAPGVYSIQIDGVSGSLIRSVNVDLKIDDIVPAQPTNQTPPDLATGVNTVPTFTWTASPQTTGYRLEVATDAGFTSVVYSADVNEPTHTPEVTLESLTDYFWRVRTSNSCGIGAFSATSSFQTLDVPPILLVDDDDNGPDVRADYTATLDALGWTYDIWDTANSDTEPSALQLAPYDVVIWFTGDEFGGVAGPGAAGESALTNWLFNRGCLLISSQDYFFDRGLTTFMQNHLGLASATSDVTQTTITGAGTVFGFLGRYTTSFPYTNFTDTLIPDATAQTSFDGSVSSTAIDRDNGLYQTSFWSFGLEVLPTAQDQQDTLSTFLGWCDALALDDNDSDGIPNGNDCAPGDGSVWKIPDPATELRVTHEPVGNLTWIASADPGGVSSVYDVLRSSDPSDFSATTCVASDLSVTLSTDAEDPVSGTGQYYLIRARNACGGQIGSDSSGSTRPNPAACP